MSTLTDELKKEKLTEEQAMDLAERFVEEGQTFQTLAGISDETMEAVYALAFNQYNNGKYEDADKLFSFLTTFDPTMKKFWMGLAATRQMRKDYENAINCYSMAAVLDIEDPLPPLRAADCHLILGNRTQAINALTEAVRWSADQEKYAEVNERAKTLLNLLQSQETEDAASDKE